MVQKNGTSGWENQSSSHEFSPFFARSQERRNVCVQIKIGRFFLNFPTNQTAYYALQDIIPCRGITGPGRLVTQCVLVGSLCRCLMLLVLTMTLHANFLPSHLSNLPPFFATGRRRTEDFCYQDILLFPIFFRQKLQGVLVKSGMYVIFLE